MERTAVVGDDDRAVRDGGGEREDVAVVSDDRQIASVRGDCLGLLSFAGTGQQRNRVAIGEELLGQLAVTIIAPMLRPSIESTGVQSEERPIEIDPHAAQASMRFIS